MATALPIAPAVRFHLSLNVSNLERSVGFYRILFGREPAKCRPDYAKFELDDPPLVLSLEPMAGATGGVLNHLGFRMPDSVTLVAMQKRLEEAGIRSRREEGVECCYARQTKFWVTDPDQTLWEMYTLDEDLDHRGVGQTREEMVSGTNRSATDKPMSVPPAVWEHTLGQPVPESIARADDSVEEVRLRGTFNQPLTDDVKRRLLREADRVLRPGGRLFVHVLVADKPLAGAPHLPGPAAAVRHVPLDSEPPRLLKAAGFQAIKRIKFEDKPCFVVDGVAMREMQLEGYKSSAV
ncbi:MAG TPA: ArsI/CadI family heavy metal resistance metalloenzyme [Gemmataceae bacterium]|nr:ArsI/CadI family heavy metal resistance metalloenzyme [Gemmataceae bacterium]